MSRRHRCADCAGLRGPAEQLEGRLSELAPLRADIGHDFAVLAGIFGRNPVTLITPDVDGPLASVTDLFAGKAS